MRFTPENVEEFNKALAKKMQDLKKNGIALNIRQGYKGTGSKSASRQIWVTMFEQLFQGCSCDVWLESKSAHIGGVVRNSTSNLPIPYEGLTVAEVYAKIEERISALKANIESRVFLKEP